MGSMAAATAKKKPPAARTGNPSRKTRKPANAKKGNTGTKKKRSGSGSTSARRSGNARRRRENRGVGQEVLLVLILAVSALIFLANLGLIGRYGTVVSDALFGSFGLMAYMFPFFLFFGFAFFLANRGNPLIFRKMAGLVLMFCFLAAFLQLLTLETGSTGPVSDFYTVSSEDHVGGGFIGGILIRAFAYVLGTVGAYVLTVCGLIVAAIVLTQKPLLTQLGSGSRKAARRVREGRKQHREERLRLKEEEQERWLLEDDARREEQELEREKRREDRERARIRKKREQEIRNRKRRRKASAPVFHEDEADDADSLLLRATLERPDPEIIAERNVRKRRPKPIPESAFEGTSPESETDVSEASSRTSGKKKKIPAAQAVSAPPFEWIPETPSPEPFVVPSFLQNSAAVGNGTESGPAGDFFLPDDGPAESAARADVPDSADSSEPVQTEATAPSEETVPAGRRKKREEAAPASEISAEITEKESGNRTVYRLPPVTLLTKGKAAKSESKKSMLETAQKLEKTLGDFGVGVKVVNVSRGPTVTRYELQPDHGVKVSRIINLQDDIKLNLATSEIRIEAPIPGKAAVGIEVPNKEVAPVMLRDLCETAEFSESRAALPFAVGKDIGGNPVIADIEKMPHLLIAGATGSGKSVCINTLIMSILLKEPPDRVKFLMIDPKVVELKIYDGIPHLLIPVVTDARKAAGALNWAVQEMTKRYNKFAEYPGVRDIKSYNARVEKMNRELDTDEQIPVMPRIVVIVDELADLMMVASSEVEDAICRLAQLARAAGIHLIIATQRPSVNVVTGLIKANMPSRVALAVTSGIDSRTILDMNGAEKLLGHGDMLFYPQSYPKPARVQGCFVSDRDITEVVRFLTAQTGDPAYDADVEEQISTTGSSLEPPEKTDNNDRDEYFADAGRLIIEKDKASIGMLQRAYKIGFNRAARIMDQLAEAGAVGGEEGTKPRKILMTAEEFEAFLSENG